MRVAMFTVDGMVDSAYGLVLDVLDAANILGPQLGLATPPFSTASYGLSPVVRTARGLELRPEPWEALADHAPDVLVTSSLGLVESDALVQQIRGHAVLPGLQRLRDDGVQLAGACSGTFFLAEAGVLDGHRATTSWWLGPAFRARYPGVQLDESQALVVDEGVTTAGAAFAHIDLAMSLVRRVSPALADRVAHYLAVGDRPTQAAVALPSVLAGSDPVLAAFDRYVRDNLAGVVDIGEAARTIGVSTRTLQRATAGTLGMSPVRYVQQVRLDHAVALLRTTGQSAARVAAAVGYQNPATLRTLLRRRRGATIAGVRHQTSANP